MESDRQNTTNLLVKRPKTPDDIAAAKRRADENEK